MLKKKIKFILDKTNIYSYIKYSDLYDLYLYLFWRSHWKKFLKVVSFFENLIGVDSLIFDIGANQGSKTDVYRRFAKQVVCIEPDKKSVNVLKKRFKNRSNIEIMSVAIGNNVGKATFYIHKEGSCYNTMNLKQKNSLEEKSQSDISEKIAFNDSYEVEMVTLDNLIKKWGIPKYIKLDVEGYELYALQGLNYPVEFISFEANLPVFINETIECINLIKKLSSSAKYKFSTQEGFTGELSAWLTYEEILSFISNTNLPFLEIMACLKFENA
ncbi:methyltransferase FkbM family [Stanieria cyanosphaera PCC 7437]|uniref:Methyltransferase FkbM family n=1 Tax=Stanieria cyanosphaera (strain ATCC 29371 / PCC 7437) TaxID=111780 RepID=K9XUN6_STAC7|nr:FkbM family methyltransferase [Stanieria cyanosphaera]AFZ35774.1 methyltransferase FkbM family [Stanieria cyanosphaera PCC 7437]